VYTGFQDHESMMGVERAEQRQEQEKQLEEVTQERELRN
jgi:hypothetical protein